MSTTMAPYVKPVILKSMNINEIIFSRTAPAKKVEIVKNLSEGELLMLTPDSARRIIREVGSTIYKSRDKELRLSNRTGNDWNSEVIGLRTYKSILYLDLYVQYSNTDTTVSETYERFFAHGDYRGSITRNDSYGNPRTFYFTYTISEKAECVRALLLQYLHNKYKERLGED